MIELGQLAPRHDTDLSVICTLPVFVAIITIHKRYTQTNGRTDDILYKTVNNILK